MCISNCYNCENLGGIYVRVYLKIGFSLNVFLAIDNSTQSVYVGTIKLSGALKLWASYG